VSHNMSAILTLCKRGILLEKGGIVLDSDSNQAVAQYLNTEELSSVVERPIYDSTKKLHIYHATLLNHGKVTNSFATSETLTLQIKCRVSQRIREAQIAFDFATGSGEYLFSSTHQDFTGEKGELTPGDHVFECEIPLQMFRQGQYRIGIASSVPNVEMLDFIEQPLVFEIVDDSSPMFKLGQERKGIIVPMLQWQISKASEVSQKETVGLST